MILFPADILAKLAANGAASQRAELDHQPVVKIFNPMGGATWLLTESDPDEPDILFGLCDLGMGSPELGNVRRSELEQLRIPGRLPLERDLYFRADKPLSHYTEQARIEQRIIA